MRGPMVRKILFVRSSGGIVGGKRTEWETKMSTLKLHSRLAVTTLVSTLVAATMSGLATPASAAVPGLTIVSATSATDSDDHKSARASCPGNTVAIGSGATVEGGLGEVNIESVVPSSDSVSALAYEDANGTN